MSTFSPLLWSTTWTLISLIFLIIVCFQYDSVLSVYVKDCSGAGTPSGGEECVYIPLQGVGFFSAGYLANGATVPGARLGDNRVLWSDLTTANVCVPGSDIFVHYAMPLSLCHRTVDGSYEFVIPKTIRQLQMEIRIAMASAFVSVVSAMVYMCSQSYRLAVTAIGMSATAVIASAHCVKLWVNWKGTSLYTSTGGFFIPLWADEKTALSAGHGDGTIMIERFHLELNNPQFQLLVATVPAFFVGVLGTACVVYQRQLIVTRDRARH